MQDSTIILSLTWIIAFFSFYKYYKIQKKINYMEENKATCTDFIIKNTYKRKYYIYYYKVDHKDIIIEDKMLIPYMKKRIKIGSSYKIYLNSHNDHDYVSPIELITYKLYLFISICLIIIPLFILY